MISLLATGIFTKIFTDIGSIAFGSIAIFSLVIFIIIALIMFKMNVPSPLILMIIGLGAISMFILYGDNKIIKIILSIIAIILGTVFALFITRLFNDTR